MTVTISPTNEKVEQIRPTEILCQILQFVVESDGVKALLPSSHVSVRWRRAALSDSSLWTTIYLSQTPPPLLDMVLPRTGNQLLTVHADHPDLERHAEIWALVNRFQELHYSASLQNLAPFLASLGPAPNLKVLHLRPAEGVLVDAEELVSGITIQNIFSGRLPSLRNLVLTNTAIWPTGLFKNLTRFECGVSSHFPISPAHLFDALRESCLIESLRVVGCCVPISGPEVPPVVLSSLKNCTMVGEGVAALIRFIAVPATALVQLGKTYTDNWDGFPDFNKHCVGPGLRILGEVSVVSFSIKDDGARLRARNDRGGALDVKVYGLYYLSGQPLSFATFIRSSFECWRACPGLKTAKEFTLYMERDGVWGPDESTYNALNLVRLISNLPGIEEAKLHGIPPLEFSSILGCLSRGPKVKLRCPNLKRLDIESSPLRSPRLLLAGLGKLLATRKEVGAPFQSVTVKVRCEMLIPATEHCALLTTWEGLVGGGVRLEYEQIEVKKLLKRRHPPEDGEDEDDADEDEGGEVVDGEVYAGDPSDCVGWDGWPENWPKTVEEMRGQ